MRTVVMAVCGVVLGCAVFAMMSGEQLATSSVPRSYTTWSSYGGSPDQSRYSSLKQIDTSNVARLEVAWTYDTGEAGGLQTQPIVVDGILFGYTPTHKTFAVKAGTGEILWTFDSKIPGRGPESWAHVLGERQRPPRLRGGRSIRLRARCGDRQAHRIVRPRPGGSISVRDSVAIRLRSRSG